MLPPSSRNDPCPCGSGKRYKNCHGDFSAVARSTPAPASGPPSATSADEEVKRALGLHHSGNLAGAEAIYRSVLSQVPKHPVAKHYLGVIRYQQKDLAAALPLLESSVAQMPHEAEFHNNLGLALAAADREADAIQSYRAALSLKQDHATAWNNLGLTLQATGDIAGAIQAFRRAIELKPDFGQAHWNLSLPLLLIGECAEGWREYEWRLALPELGRDRHAYPGPVWDTASAAGKIILLYAEQGLGDAVQFARYATLLARRGARVILNAHAELKALLATVPGVAEVRAPGEALPRYDAHFPLLSLARAFATTIETIPATVPYVTAPAERCAQARAMLARHRGALKVGLAWAGNKLQANDRNRSMSLEVLSPLLELPGITWFSLQKGEAAGQIAAVPGGDRLVPLPADAHLDLTAALIAELDLVISVDTSISHLAGAMARPVWTMLCFMADWRYPLGRDNCPWYPTMRLFRQSAPRDWASVVVRVASALRTGTLLATRR